jgi:hypothetical protein
MIAYFLAGGVDCAVSCLYVDAIVCRRQERLEFLYESGLAVGKGSSDGFQALQQPAPAAAASSSAAPASAAGSSKVIAVGPYLPGDDIYGFARTLNNRC